MELSSLKPFLDSRTPPVRLIAVGGEALGHEEFSGYWKGEKLLFDLGKQSLFRIMGAGKQGLLSGVFSYYTGAQRRLARNQHASNRSCL